MTRPAFEPVHPGHLLRDDVLPALGLNVTKEVSKVGKSAREEGELVPLLTGADLPTFETYFVYPEGAKASKRISVFRDFLVAKAREWSF